MQLTGIAHFEDASRLITADKVFWEHYRIRHISQISKLFIDTSDNLKRIICGDDYALNCTTKATLYNYYKSHKQETVESYLKYFIKKTPKKLQRMLENNTHSVNGIVEGALKN